MKYWYIDLFKMLEINKDFFFLLKEKLKILGFCGFFIKYFFYIYFYLFVGIMI